MKENSRIRFNPVTKEIEVEGSESFVKTYFSKLEAMISGSSKKVAVAKEKPIKGKAAPKKKIEKKIKATKSPVNKVNKPGEKKVTNIDRVIALIQASTEGIKTAELIEKTGLNKNQIWNIVNRATKERKIKKVKMGLYGAV